MTITRWICAVAVVLVTAPGVLVATAMAVVLAPLLLPLAALAATIMVAAVFVAICMALLVATPFVATYMLRRHFGQPAAPVEVGCRPRPRRCD